MNDTLTAALEYARLGYLVLPLIGKQPASNLVPHGKNDATSDYAFVRRWFGAGCHNLGVLPPAQVLVLDFDDPEELPPTLARHPELEAAPIAITGGGGYHIWLRLPEGVSLTAKVRALPNTDSRGMNRTYLVAPPSVHPVTGWPYRWVNPLVAPDDLPPIPPELLQRLLPTSEPAMAYKPTQPATASQKRLEGLLGWVCAKVVQAPVGTRHATLLAHARLVGGWLHHGFNQTEVHEQLTAAGIAAGLPRYEAEKTARDGIAYGQQTPLRLPDDLPPSKPKSRSSRLVARWGSV
ncbi:MAG: bifunctional DNA primase/polymerase [Meiothermus sp.]|nr:bifunctional DNA primase/polymerase [Meiothermus sp.]